MLLRANCYVNFELNLTKSVVVLLPAVALPGAGVDNGVVMLPVITLLDLILFIKIVTRPI
ncbi:MAG: hypothetical protein WBE34_03340 [Candidatus Nitrosopolaris sp.]